MSRKKRIGSKKKRHRITSKFYAPPAVANAIANSYGCRGAWEDFLTKS